MSDSDPTWESWFMPKSFSGFCLKFPPLCTEYQNKLWTSRISDGAQLLSVLMYKHVKDCTCGNIFWFTWIRKNMRIFHMNLNGLGDTPPPKSRKILHGKKTVRIVKLIQHKLCCHHVDTHWPCSSAMCVFVLVFVYTHVSDCVWSFLLVCLEEHQVSSFRSEMLLGFLAVVLTLSLWASEMLCSTSVCLQIPPALKFVFSLSSFSAPVFLVLL